MSLAKLLGIVLIVGGVLALVYRGFNYTDSSHEAKLGKLEFTLHKKEHVEIPMWAGIVAVAAGAGLLLAGSRR